MNNIQVCRKRMMFYVQLLHRLYQCTLLILHLANSKQLYTVSATTPQDAT